MSLSQKKAAQNAAVERSGGHILADQLKILGVDTVFCVPGESFLDLHNLYCLRL